MMGERALSAAAAATRRSLMSQRECAVVDVDVGIDWLVGVAVYNKNDENLIFVCKIYPFWVVFEAVDLALQVDFEK